MIFSKISDLKFNTFLKQKIKRSRTACVNLDSEVKWNQ